MCGRTALNVGPDQVRRCTGVPRWIDEERYRTSTNVVPTRYQPVIVPFNQLQRAAQHDGGDAHHDQALEASITTSATSPPAPLAATPAQSSEPETAKVATAGTEEPNVPTFFSKEESSKYVMKCMKWGLINQASTRMGVAPINARDDSIIEGKPMFSRLRQRRRCVVVAQGFFEWVRTGKQKSPYYVTRTDGQLLYMAGLWNEMVQEEGTDPVFSYTIITTDNTPALAFLHDRMPALLDHDAACRWLAVPLPNEEPTVANGGWSNALAKLLKPDDTGLQWYPVDPRVGKAGTEDPKFLVPYEEEAKPTKGTLLSYFNATPKKAGATKKGEASATSTPSKQKDSHAPVKDEPTSAARQPSISPTTSPKSSATLNSSSEVTDGAKTGSKRSRSPPPKKAAKTPPRKRQSTQPTRRSPRYHHATSDSDAVEFTVEYE